MAMAMMSSFFFTFCDFYVRRLSYQQVTLNAELSRFPIATVAAAMMFVAQIVALPIYLKIIKAKSKRFAYITGCIIWMVVVAFMWLLPAEGKVDVVNGSVQTVDGVPNWLIMMFGLLLGLGIGGTVFVPHSSFGDVCDVGELYFGERTEGAFSGITNFLNTTAQAIGLAIPPAIIGLAGYVETQYVTTEQYNQILETGKVIINGKDFGGIVNFKATLGNGSVQLLPVSQPEGAQLAIRICFIVLPIVIMGIAIFIASKYKLTSDLQKRIVEANARTDKDSDEFKQLREELLGQL
jgi:Na+/melibiose symporter-like transporter